MALYGISQEGADAMQKLAKDLLASARGMAGASRTLKRNISSLSDGLGSYAAEIAETTLHLDGILDKNLEAVCQLARQAEQKADEILELLAEVSGIGNPSGSGQTSSFHQTNQSVKDIKKWVKKINPNYNNPFYPIKNPYRQNCGSCAFAVECRLLGVDPAARAGAENIGTDAGMEAATGKKCVYMPPESIEQQLYAIGPGAHLIVGINRRPVLGIQQSGHWFNAYYDGEKIYTIDGQSGRVMDWPHDYGFVSEWCALL